MIRSLLWFSRYFVKNKATFVPKNGVSSNVENGGRVARPTLAEAMGGLSISWQHFFRHSRDVPTTQRLPGYTQFCVLKRT